MDRDGCAGQDRQFLGAELGGLIADPVLDEAFGRICAGGRTARGRMKRVRRNPGPRSGPSRARPSSSRDRRACPGACSSKAVPSGRSASPARDWYMAKTSRGLLRLVGAEAAGGVQDARRHVPAGARLQAISAGEVGDLVVALGKSRRHSRAGPSWCPGSGRRRCRENRRRGCSPAAGSSTPRACRAGRSASRRARRDGGRGGAARPGCRRTWSTSASAVLVPDPLADQCALELRDGVAQEERSVRRAVFEHDEAEALVRAVSGPLSAGVVEANQRSSMPPRLPPEGVVVVGVELDPPARDAEGARHPVGREAHDAFSLFQRSFG